MSSLRRLPHWDPENPHVQANLLRWRTATSPQDIRGHTTWLSSPRKERLLLVACCRRFGAIAGDPLLCEGLDASERYADRLITRDQLCTVHDRMRALAVQRDRADHVTRVAADLASRAITLSCQTRLVSRAIYAASIMVTWKRTADDASRVWNDRRAEAASAEQKVQADLHRDVHGLHAGYGVPIDPGWLTSTVVSLAHGFYDAKAFDRLPILADALQDAGCENQDVLDHCRMPGPHVRGCWVIDLLLNKS